MDKDNYIFNIWENSRGAFMKTEEYLYPWSSLVPDFGGTLGLFLEFSFMTLWDGVQWVEDTVREIKNIPSLFP